MVVVFECGGSTYEYNMMLVVVFMHAYILRCKLCACANSEPFTSHKFSWKLLGMLGR